MPKLRILVAMVLVPALFSGCVYYNTFYNARKRYEDADARRLEAESQPDRANQIRVAADYYLLAIRKASTILQLHPDSKWVDDSLLLIGKAYYWRQEYGEAIQKFRELENNFADSELRPEYRYWLALTQWELGQRAEARDLLREVGRSDSEFSGLARLTLAERDAELGDMDAAIESYSTLLETSRDKDLRSRIYKGLGDAYFATGRLDEAVETYADVLKFNPPPGVEFDTHVRVGEIQEIRSNYDGAYETYDRVENSARLKQFEPTIRLKKANLLRLMGNLEAARAEYESILEAYPRSEYAAEALYRLGLMEYRDRHDLDAAMELLSQARRERSGTDASDRARELENTLYQLKREKARAEGGGPRSLDAHFGIAELYLFNLGQTDSAMASYERALAIADTSDRELAPKAMYAIATISADSLGDEERANAMFRRLIDAYPVTAYAIDARRRIAASESDDAVAEARFVAAERLINEGADAARAIPIFEEVTRDYPNSIFAPKALYAMAWSLENDLARFEDAQAAYTRLVETYPLTKFAEQARERLEGGYLKEAIEAANAPPPPPEPEALPAAAEAKAAPDSTATGTPAERAPVSPPTDAAASADTVAAPKAPASPEGPFDFDQVEKPPRLISAPRPEPREELLEEEVDPVVEVRILVGTNGEVKRVEVLSGSDILTDAAIMNASQFRFEPGEHGGKPVEVYMTFPIRFAPPGDTN